MKTIVRCVTNSPLNSAGFICVTGEATAYLADN